MAIHCVAWRKKRLGRRFLGRSIYPPSRAVNGQGAPMAIPDLPLRLDARRGGGSDPGDRTSFILNTAIDSRKDAKNAKKTES
jgi:hypothetical protein